MNRRSFLKLIFASPLTGLIPLSVLAATQKQIRWFVSDVTYAGAKANEIGYLLDGDNAIAVLTVDQADWLVTASMMREVLMSRQLYEGTLHFYNPMLPEVKDVSKLNLKYDGRMYAYVHLIGSTREETQPFRNMKDIVSASKLRSQHILLQSK